MSARVTFAVARRVLQQLRRDPRTLVLIVAVPCLLETLLQQLFRGGPQLPARRRAAARAVPARDDVPRHLDHDAARADERDARAADDDAAREVRPARRLRDRVRAAGGRPGHGRLGGRPSACSASRRRGRAWLVVGARRRERGARLRARPVRERVRADRVPGRPVHAGVRAARRSSSAGSSSLATRWRPGCSWISAVMPLTYAYDALARAAADTSTPASPPTSPSCADASCSRSPSARRRCGAGLRRSQGRAVHHMQRRRVR